MEPVRPARVRAKSMAALQPAPQESYGSPADGSTLPQSPTITAAREEAERAGFSRDQ